MIYSAVGIPASDQAMISRLCPVRRHDGGLEPGDIILSVDGDVIENIDALIEVINRMQDETTLTIEREGQTSSVQIVPRIDPPEGEGAMGLVYKSLKPTPSSNPSDMPSKPPVTSSRKRCCCPEG